MTSAGSLHEVDARPGTTIDRQLRQQTYLVIAQAKAAQAKTRSLAEQLTALWQRAGY